MSKPIRINNTIKKFNSKITTIPGDKSISIRTVLISSLGVGKSIIKGLSDDGTDVKSSIKCCQKLGILIKRKKNITEIYGKGINGFFYKKNLTLDAGNSATVGRCILGSLVRSPYKIKLIGDASLSKRDFFRVIKPLQEFGATFYPKGKKTLPIYIKGTNFVRPIKFQDNIGSAQIKTSFCLAALNSPGISFMKSARCRDHTEKMFKYLKIPIKIKKEKNYDLIKIKGLKNFKSFNYHIPADPSSAAFFVMLTILSKKNSSMLIKNCLTNENRIGFYKVLRQMGAKIIAISDYYGAIHNPNGLPIQQLFQYAAERRPLTDYSDADQISNQEILELECDLLIPAAIGGVITGENANRIQASAIFEAANSPTTISGEQVLADRGIPVFPDILVNAGGVIVSYFEWVQNIQQFRWDINRVDKEMKEMLIKAYKNVSEIHKSKGVSLRTAAFIVGVERVAKSTELRGYLT